MVRWQQVAFADLGLCGRAAGPHFALPSRTPPGSIGKTDISDRKWCTRERSATGRREFQ